MQALFLWTLNPPVLTLEDHFALLKTDEVVIDSSTPLFHEQDPTENIFIEILKNLYQCYYGCDSQQTNKKLIQCEEDVRSPKTSTELLVH